MGVHLCVCLYTCVSVCAQACVLHVCACVYACVENGPAGQDFALY